MSVRQLHVFYLRGEVKRHVGHSNRGNASVGEALRADAARYVHQRCDPPAEDGARAFIAGDLSNGDIPFSVRP
jgi:hypothetical protein